MSVPSIHIGKVLVPIVDYAVGAAAVLGIRDSGKTVTSKGIAEQLLENNVPIIVFDAVGKWRWMKVAGDRPGGKSYKVVVAGGRGPDLPLTPHSVPEIVRSALKERIPLIIDLFDKSLAKADWRRIVQTAIRIIHYENEGGAVHVFLEEAAEFCPQRIEDGATYAEVEKLVRMGGNASVGITLINQRAQEVNKAVLDQCTTLILGCQVGNKAIENVGKWVERLDSDTAEAVTSSLPRLVAGEAWVWTRQNLDKPSREKFPMCRSLHPDRRTPEMVLKSAKATDTAEFVAKLSSSIPKIIEEQKANDPVELKREIAKLKREMAQAKPAMPKAEVKEVPVLTREERSLLDRLNKNLETICQQKVVAVAIVDGIAKLVGLLSARSAPNVTTPRPSLPRPVSEPIPRPVPARRPTEPATNGHASLPKAERCILRVLANFPDGKTRREIGVIAGYKHSGGGFNNALGSLRSMGLVSGSDPVRITQAGLDAYGPVDPLPTGEQLFDYWMNHQDFGRAEREALRVLYEAHRPMSKEEIAPLTVSDRGTPYEANGGGFNNAIGRLRTYELIEGGRGELQAIKEFFD